MRLGTRRMADWLLLLIFELTLLAPIPIDATSGQTDRVVVQNVSHAVTLLLPGWLDKLDIKVTSKGVLTFLKNIQPDTLCCNHLLLKSIVNLYNKDKFRISASVRTRYTDIGNRKEVAKWTLSSSQQHYGVTSDIPVMFGSKEIILLITVTKCLDGDSQIHGN